jgi:hypothetical protein
MPQSERHTDRKAEVVATRPVINATVVHAPVARLRRSEFEDVVLELTALPNPEDFDESTGEQPMFCAVAWYGYTPEDRQDGARVRVSGAWDIKTNYTGDVVAEFGRRET